MNKFSPEIAVKDLSEFAEKINEGNVKVDVAELTSRLLMLCALAVNMDGRIEKLEATIEKLRRAL